ncbi:fumarate reductase/succinate dehydrogenase flavoprotein domain protein [Xylanimonas cellulosilytica DSM 15894]|uniref:Fumarate reductase/succinate dehydrogenase flavoprotein domain protein n=1 Tax=Xylanimonas cellulosilytica (strain DSM 15894 / JCM 12276 / CECT 5975 / KCTC 9989 / LMG 20990 / NBRC 107835 / XIL07) TaxID=446471 RepID=D1BVW0_XYLCX|nr:FAD-binding dehydrogenase [Xylanimonas cellulosilytica]ACZ31429.1 fumarate reductase/succinate dehydrogenase flavoprotein domain protein [Xylanimonas cellulosilytica DSM 15894]
MSTDADVVVIGAGLSGLVTACEVAASGRRVVVLDQEHPDSLGGQAWWSFGGLFLVGSPEQRRVGVRDSAELAWADWLGSAGFAPGAAQGEGPDRHGYAWAQHYVEFAAGGMRSWLHGLGVRWFPLVQWAERGGYPAGGPGVAHGNSVPRFHVTWGTGPAILAPFVAHAKRLRDAGRLEIRFRHRVTSLVVTDGRVTGVQAEVLAPDDAARSSLPFAGRAAPSSRTVVGTVEIAAGAVVVASGGIGANHAVARDRWDPAAGTLPERMLQGVPDSTDGLMLGHAAAAGAALVHEDRMWHYPEGIADHSPVWTRHGIRILAGPSSLWLDADGVRLPAPLYPGFDALGALQHVTRGEHDHSWFVLNKTIMDAEFALSGSEQNPDLTGKDLRLLTQRVLPGAVGPVARFAQSSPEFVWASTPAELAAKMNALTAATPGSSGTVDPGGLERLIALRDAQVLSGLGKDPQVVATRAARTFWVDRRIRVAPPRALTDPKDGPLLAVRLSVLTRKTLGGLWCDPSGRVLHADGSVLDGLWAVGEAAGFGGGGVHGHRALEGTFLGGCLHTGRVTGRALVG